MLHATRTLTATCRMAAALAVALTGCAQVLDIEDWKQGGPGGGGGSGGDGAQGVSATSASAGPGGGAQSASAVGSGGGTTEGEICTNGADDDSDGHIDCEDPDCADHTCVPAAPLDWTGPVAVYLGSSADAVPECGPAWSKQSDWLAGTLTAPPAQCTTCDCLAPSGGQCTLNTGTGVTFYQDIACTVVDVMKPITMPNTCTPVTSSAADISAYKVVGSATASGGTCTAIGGAATKPPASFDKVVRICEGASDGAGCSTGTCTPPPRPGFRPQVCIYKQVGDTPGATCPTGYSALAFVYQDIADTRGCTGCQCGAPVNRTCELKAQFYYDNACTNPPAGIPHTFDLCNTLANPTPAVTLAFTMNPGTPMGGMCSPTAQSAPTGGASGTNRVMICCPGP